MFSAKFMERHLNSKHRAGGNNNLKERKTTKTNKKTKKPRASGENQSKERNLSTERKDPRNIEGSERGPSGSRSGSNATTSQENPASQIVSQDRIKTEPTDQLNNTEQKASLTFLTVQNNGNRTVRVRV